MRLFMTRILFLLVFILALVSPHGFAQDDVVPPLLVITDLRTVGGESSFAEARAFSEFARKEIEKTGQYRVISRSSMMSIVKANSFQLPCHELVCFVRLGRLLGADEVMAGYLQRQGDFLEITLRLIDVNEARFKKTVYHTAPNLPPDDLLGEWGLGIVYELFEIDADLLQTMGEEDQAGQPKIPDRIKFKYPGMAYIPAGETIIGSNNGDVCEYPPHAVFVDAFYIGTYEVTNQEYEKFVKATGHRAPSHWVGGRIPRGLDTHPVTWVSYEDAEAYCQWKDGRLPTEEEWERAARGNKLMKFPWGESFDKTKANTWEAGNGETVPVGAYPKGKSPFGVEDMAGNVFEWVSGFFTAYPGAKVRLKDYDKHLRVLRGGSWNFNDYYARTSHRFARSGGERSRSFGFRIARD